MKKIVYLLILLNSFSQWGHCQGLKMASTSTTRALVIGISDYSDEDIPDLQFAHRDAEAFVTYLKSKSGGELKDEHIKMLTNEKATAPQIFGALDWLIEESGKNDKVIIYFSGHGDVEAKIIRQNGYLLTHDTPSTNYRISSLRVEDVSAYLETLVQLNESKIVLFTDACRSGNLAGGSVGVQATATALATQFENTVKIMSCQANELSLEGEQWGGGRGIFSYHLVDALTGMADDNNDLSVNLLELRRYLEDKITQETDFSQLPVVQGSMGTKISFVHAESLAELRKNRETPSTEFGFVNNKGNEASYLMDADSSIKKLYIQFVAAVDNQYFLPSEVNNTRSPGKSASELYEFLSKEPSIKMLHGSMKRNFAAALQDEAQHSLNGYLKADPKEMAERWESYGESYRSNPNWLNKAAEILGDKHRVYNQIRAKQYYFQGVILRLEGEKTGNEKLFKKAFEKEKLALQFDDKAAYIYNELGLIYGNLNEKEKEIKMYEKAMQIAPKWVLPPYNLSTTYNDMGNYKEGLKWGKKASLLSANLVHPFLNIGTSYWGLGELTKADSMYKICLEKDSNYYRACFYIGCLADDQQEYQNAEKSYLKTLEIKPDYVSCHINLGNLYVATKQLNKAEKSYLKVLSLEPDHQWGHYNMICLKALQNKPETALKWMEKTLKTGFNDYASLISDDDLASIRVYPKFNAMMKKYFPEKSN